MKKKNPLETFLSRQPSILELLAQFLNQLDNLSEAIWGYAWEANLISQLAGSEAPRANTGSL